MTAVFYMLSTFTTSVHFLKLPSLLTSYSSVHVPLTVSCFSKVQIGFTFLVPAHLGSPGKRAVKRVCVCVHVHGSGQGASYGGYGQPMSSSQPAAEVMEPSQQQLTQSTYQGPAAAVVPSVGGAASGGSGQAPSAGYVGQQPTPAAQQQQTFNPNSRLVCCTSDARKAFAFLFLCSFCFS